MRSLRGTLLVGIGAGTTAVFLAAGVLLYFVLERALRSEFDESLASSARALAALCEVSDEGVEFEPGRAPLPNFGAGIDAEFFQIWLPDGRVLARSASLAGDSLTRPPSADPQPRFSSAPLPDGRPGRAVTLSFTPRPDDDEPPAAQPLQLALVVARGTRSFTHAVATVRNGLLAVGASAIVLAIAICAAVVDRALRPVDRLGRQIAALDAAALHQRVDADGIPAEFEPIAARLNHLLARVEAAFERERRFTGDVAHELRTPLAGLRARLELTLSRSRNPEAYQRALEECLRIDLHLQRMVESLLLLARADADQLQPRASRFSLAALIRDGWAPLAARAAARRLSVDLDVDAAPEIEADRELVALVVQNLLENAVQYADEGGRLRILCGSDALYAQVEVSNTGATLAPQDVERVFDRFWRGAAGTATAADGHCGLGLALCRAVIERLGGSISATLAPKAVFVASIAIPRASAPV